MKPIIGFGVRLDGHWCAAVKTGFSRRFVLMRARKGEERFLSRINFVSDDRGALAYELRLNAERIARGACARAIKRTKWARRKLVDPHYDMLRGVANVERVLRGANTSRRGRRWKICPIFREEPAQVVDNPAS